MASSSTTGQNIFTEPIDHFIFAGALVVFVFVTVVAERLQPAAAENRRWPGL